jgi:membrane protease YdiL (CAAX protease family)
MPAPVDVARGGLGLLIAAPALLTASFLAAIVFSLFTGRAPSPIAHDTLKAISEQRRDPWVAGLIATAVLFGPMLEELLFRAFIQSALLKATGRAWPAILITSLLFMAAHIGSVKSDDTQALFPLLVFGMVLGIAYERTRRIWVPITMHMLFNVANVAAALLMPS